RDTDLQRLGDDVFAEQPKPVQHRPCEGDPKHDQYGISDCPQDATPSPGLRLCLRHGCCWDGGHQLVLLGRAGKIRSHAYYYSASSASDLPDTWDRRSLRQFFAMSSTRLLPELLAVKWFAIIADDSLPSQGVLGIWQSKQDFAATIQAN